jgi:GNAT superfamily N-acetyltransferase
VPKADRADIRVAVSAADLETVHAIRREVFIVEQKVPEDEEWDDLDQTSLHLLAIAADGTPLGTGRLIHGEQALKITGREGTVLLGRLAVSAAARGTGLGVGLVRAIEDRGGRRGGGPWPAQPRPRPGPVAPSSWNCTPRPTHWASTSASAMWRRAPSTWTAVSPTAR